MEPSPVRSSADAAEGAGSAEGRLRDVHRRRWAQVAAQSARDLWAANALEWAAALSFYLFLSLFPLLISVMIAASYLVEPTWATERATDLLGSFLPRGQLEVEAIVDAAIAERGRVGAISFVLLLVTGRRALGAVAKGIALMSDVDERDDTVERRAGVEMIMFAGLIGLVLLAFAARPLIALASETLDVLPGPDSVAMRVAHGVTDVVVLLAVFTLLYVVVPRGRRPWRAAVAGGVIATVLFLIAQGVFRLVIGPVWTNLELIYGPLAVAALLLTWGWYVALSTLAGAAFASHTKVMVLEGEGGEQAGRDHAG